MIIDEESYGEEHVTVELTIEQQNYIITFQKSDLDLLKSNLDFSNNELHAKLYIFRSKVMFSDHPQLICLL